MDGTAKRNIWNVVGASANSEAENVTYVWPRLRSTENLGLETRNQCGQLKRIAARLGLPVFSNRKYSVNMRALAGSIERCGSDSAVQ